jgi:hypothetical protein
MGEPVRERSIVGEEENARRVGVESSDGHDPKGMTDEADDRRPPVGIASGRHHAGRLVQEDVCKPLRLQSASVDLDDVPRCDERVQAPGLTVDAHASRLDEIV